MHSTHCMSEVLVYSCMIIATTKLIHVTLKKYNIFTLIILKNIFNNLNFSICIKLVIILCLSKMKKFIISTCINYKIYDFIIYYKIYYTVY